MSDDESRHEHLPTEGGQIFAENGPKTVEDDQTGLPSWAAALTAQMQTPRGVANTPWLWERAFSFIAAL